MEFFKINFSHVKYLRTEKQEAYNRTYEIFSAKTMDAALKYLRGREVKERDYYVIVETEDGNVGKDLISIFNEETGQIMEHGTRKPFNSLKPSATHCAKCGYDIIPIKEKINSLARFDMDDLIKHGRGFQCKGCNLLFCASCVDAYFSSSSIDDFPLFRPKAEGDAFILGTQCAVCEKSLCYYKEVI